MNAHSYNDTGRNNYYYLKNLKCCDLLLSRLFHFFNNRINVPDNLPEDPDGSIHYGEIAWLLNLAENNKKELLELGVDFSDSQIWMIYYYDKQCNMEFDPELMERMGKLGIKLCVSCQEV